MGKRDTLQAILSTAIETLTSTGSIVRSRRFWTFLNPTDTPSIQESVLDQPRGSEPMSMAEAIGVVGELKSLRAPGLDEVCLEMLQALNFVGVHGRHKSSVLCGGREQCF